MKKPLLTLLLPLLLTACFAPERDTSPELLHQVEISEESKTAVQNMDASEYEFLIKVLGTITYEAPQARVFNLLSRPAKDVVLYGVASRKLWTITFPNGIAYISVFFDSDGHAMRVELDGGDAYMYAQDLRDLTTEEVEAVGILYEDPEFEEYQ